MAYGIAETLGEQFLLTVFQETDHLIGYHYLFAHGDALFMEEIELLVEAIFKHVLTGALLMAIETEVDGDVGV